MIRRVRRLRRCSLLRCLSTMHWLLNSVMMLGSRSFLHATVAGVKLTARQSGAQRKGYHHHYIITVLYHHHHHHHIITVLYHHSLQCDMAVVLNGHFGTKLHTFFGLPCSIAKLFLILLFQNNKIIIIVVADVAVDAGVIHQGRVQDAHF